MTIDKMLEQIENYFGEYENKKLKTYVKAYLIKDHNPNKYEEILRSILYFHKYSFKAPCIATIEECVKKARLEKGQTDTHKQVETKNKWDYKDQAKKNKDFDKVDISLQNMFKQSIKKVGE